MTNRINIYFEIWRQDSFDTNGEFRKYYLKDISTSLSLLEALDKLNEEIIIDDKRPINFDHDCREGICGSCGFLVNGQAHGHLPSTTVCQLYMRHFKNNDVIKIEPWRAKAFPIIQDLAVDRTSLDNLITSGGYYNVNTGDGIDCDEVLIKPDNAFSSFQTATCIGCGACVASCRNSSANLFAAAKLAHLAQLPQGNEEKFKRKKLIKKQLKIEGFGSCSNNLECEAACPKEISSDWISWMNKI